MNNYLVHKYHVEEEVMSEVLIRHFMVGGQFKCNTGRDGLAKPSPVLEISGVPGTEDSKRKCTGNW
jgi:hypothetical protein